MRKIKTIFMATLLLMVLIFSSCRESDRVSRNISRYAYEIEFMPQMIVPIKVTAEELKQDLMRNETEEEQDATDGLY